MKLDLLYSSYPFIVNDRVTLSKIQFSDTDTLIALFDENNIRYSPTSYMQTAETAFSAKRYIELGIFSAENPNIMLGTITAGNFDSHVNSASLSFIMRKGFEDVADYALAAISKYLFEIIEVNRLWAQETAPTPEWEKRFKHCGFIREAYLRDSVFVPEKGGLCSSVTYGLMAEDYRLTKGSVLACRKGTDTVVKMTSADFPEMSQWLTDENVLRFYDGRDNPSSLEKVTEDYRDGIMGKEDTVPCIMRENGEDIGYIQYYPIKEEISELKLEKYKNPYGIDLFIGPESCRGRGLGKRFIGMIARFLCDELCADVVVSDPQAWNLRSINAFTAAGFSQVTVLPEHEKHEGRMEANVIMHYIP